MKKTAFVEATRGMMNSVRVFEGISIANIGWLHYGWLVVPSGSTFEQVKAREYVPLAGFHTREELWHAIKDYYE